MADLKTSAEERAALLERASPLARARPWSATLALVCDVNTLLAENARLRAVAEDGRELLRMVSEVYRDPPACGVVAGINIGEIREFLAATDTPKEAP